MQIERFAIEGPLLLTPRVFSDERGFFQESWNQRSFAAALGVEPERAPLFHQERRALLDWLDGQGAIERFQTSMTGELFDLLTRHSILKTDIFDQDLAAFDAGVAAAGDGNALASRLFTARARVVGGSMSQNSVASYLSGLLIGAEVASTPTLLGIDPHTPVTVIGDPSLTRHYLRAMQGRELTAYAHDGERAGLAGLSTLATHILRQ